MTKEQLIVLGFIAAAFVVGWITGALTGGRRKDPAERASLADERLEHALEESRRDLERAIQLYRQVAGPGHEGTAAPGADEAAVGQTWGYADAEADAEAEAAAEVESEVSAAAETSPAAFSPGGTGRAERVPAGHSISDDKLPREVSNALGSDPANERMLGAVSPNRGAALSDFELDLADWGFTYGVAWAMVRERRPHGSDEEIAIEALEVAETVFRTYTSGSDWTAPITDRTARDNGPPRQRGLLR